MDKRIYGLIGRSLKHSFSVIVHQELGNPSYKLYELEPDEIEEFLSKSELKGINVTIPYKKTVMQYCDELSPLAQKIGSVNTIVRRPDGTLYGHNTDAAGFMYMSDKAGISFFEKKVVIFGSGGASVMAQTAVRSAGAADIVVVSRNGEDNYDNLSRHYDAQVLINATPVGMYPDTGKMPADPADFPHCTGVLDLIYNPRRTAFIQAAERLCIPHADGLPMLVAQARAAAEMFMETDIPLSENDRITNIIRRQTGNIVLVGMPGSGKSCIGAALAQICGRCAVDIDAQIINADGRSIPEIFAQSGEDEFRRLEREQIEIAGKQSGCIIITGGGAVKDERNYMPLHQNGRIYYIKRPIEDLPRDGRPLSQNADLSIMYAQRAPLYERFCDVIIENTGSIEEAADKIWRDYNENISD